LLEDCPNKNQLTAPVEKDRHVGRCESWAAATTLSQGCPAELIWLSSWWTSLSRVTEKTSQDASVPGGSTSANVPGRHRNQMC